MSDPVETTELLAFTKTVEVRSLSRAAAELGVPRATIGRRLARLEERLGARLLRRTTRSLVLTDAGEAFYRHAKIVIDAVDRAESSVRQKDAGIRGELRVSTPPMMRGSFPQLLCDFARKYPEVRLHVHMSTHYVDLQRDGYDVAIRASTALEPGLMARTLSRTSIVGVASPDYLAEHGTPRSTRDLKSHRLLLGFARGELPQTHWPIKGGRNLRVEGAFFSNEISLLLMAALEDMGIAFLPMVLVEPMLESGDLVRVLPGTLEADSTVSLVYLEREFVAPPVRAFIEMVAAWAPGQFSEPIKCTEDDRKRKRGRAQISARQANRSV